MERRGRYGRAATRSHTRCWVGLFALLVTVAAVRPPSCQAQSERLGIGGLTGSPSGVALRLYVRHDRALDAAASWSVGRANGSTRLYFHGLRERPIRNSPLNFFRGPGFIVGVNRRGEEDRFVMGISGLFGLNFFVERFEVFLQAMPHLEMDPELDGRVGSSAGLRYYF